MYLARQYENITWIVILSQGIWFLFSSISFSSKPVKNISSFSACFSYESTGTTFCNKILCFQALFSLVNQHFTLWSAPGKLKTISQVDGFSELTLITSPSPRSTTLTALLPKHKPVINFHITALWILHCLFATSETYLQVWWLPYLPIFCHLFLKKKSLEKSALLLFPLSTQIWTVSIQNQVFKLEGY